jgi:hypothetical protein
MNMIGLVTIMTNRQTKSMARLTKSPRRLGGRIILNITMKLFHKSVIFLILEKQKRSAALLVFFKLISTDFSKIES